MTQAPETSTVLACGWDDITGVLPPTPCQEPAIGTVTEICVHEHLFQARTCAHHAAGVQMDGLGLCYECATGAARIVGQLRASQLAAVLAAGP